MQFLQLSRGSTNPVDKLYGLYDQTASHDPVTGEEVTKKRILGYYTLAELQAFSIEVATLVANVSDPPRG